jgi:choice-of-anchor A domain-containing protein
MNMITKILGALGVASLVVAPLTTHALPVSLGTSADFALLEMGPGSVNVSIAAAPPNGYVNGDIGIAAQGKLSVSAGNFPINGTVYAWQAAGIDDGGNATGGIVVNAAKVQTAANDAFAASTAASALASSGGGSAYSGVLSVAGGTTLNLTPGVYNLTGLDLNNNSQIILAAGGSYVFNVAGEIKLDHAQILAAAGLNVNEILYNVTGSTSKVATSGGLNDESVITGTVLVPTGDVSLTPGFVDGRVLSGGSINIASGGAIDVSVPDAGSTLALMGIGLGLLAAAKQKLLS